MCCFLIKNFPGSCFWEVCAHSVINLFEWLEKVLSYLSSLPGKLNEAGHPSLGANTQESNARTSFSRVSLLQPRKGARKKLRWKCRNSNEQHNEQRRNKGAALVPSLAAWHSVFMYDFFPVSQFMWQETFLPSSSLLQVAFFRVPYVAGKGASENLQAWNVFYNIQRRRTEP